MQFKSIGHGETTVVFLFKHGTTSVVETETTYDFDILLERYHKSRSRKEKKEIKEQYNQLVSNSIYSKHLKRL